MPEAWKSSFHKANLNENKLPLADITAYMQQCEADSNKRIMLKIKNKRQQLSRKRAPMILKNFTKKTLSKQ